MVLKKSKKTNDVIFIDASEECVKVTNANKLIEENIANILEVYSKREDKDHIAKVVKAEDIGENDYNISVSTYVEKEDTRPQGSIYIPVPKYDEFFPPFMKCLSDGKVHSLSEIRSYCADYYKLSEIAGLMR